MKTLLAIASIIFLSGCAAGGPQPLRDLFYVADGWLVASYDEKHMIHTQAKQMPPIAYETNIRTYRRPVNHREILVRDNDTLQSIAEREYGSPYLWDLISMANQIKSPYGVTPGTFLTIPQPDVVNRTSNIIELDHWELRLVNSGSQDSCVRVNFMDIDYYINIQPGWYRIKPFQTLYLGNMTQEPWTFAGQVIAFDDARWVINTVDIAPYTEETKCVFQ